MRAGARRRRRREAHVRPRRAREPLLRSRGARRRGRAVAPPAHQPTRGSQRRSARRAPRAPRARAPRPRETTTQRARAAHDAGSSARATARAARAQHPSPTPARRTASAASPPPRPLRASAHARDRVTRRGGAAKRPQESRDEQHPPRPPRMLPTIPWPYASPKCRNDAGETTSTSTPRSRTCSTASATKRPATSAGPRGYDVVRTRTRTGSPVEAFDGREMPGGAERRASVVASGRSSASASATYDAS